MKRAWIPAGFSAVGLLGIVAAMFGADLAGMYVIRPLRIGLLLLGLALIGGSLEYLGLLHIRAHLVAQRNRYLGITRVLGFAAVGALVLAGYVFFVSLGTWTNWPSSTDYYDRLATALRSGRLYVQEAPDPALLALSNPYDPDARKGISGLAAQSPGTIWDMSLYRGRVYLYWGPAPALLLIPVKALIPVLFGDQTLTFAFLFGAFVFESLLLIHLWQRFFAGVPAWLVFAAMLLIGFANPGPWLLFSPRIYEAAIAAGQFFLMGGVFILVRSLDRAHASRWGLAVTAALWVCAVGSRATLAVGVAWLAVMVLAWLLWGQRGEHSAWSVIPEAAWFVLPLLFGASVLMWYNLARFGSIFEFGFRYAITMLDQNKYHDVLFSPRYLVPNAYLYLFNPPALSAQFPFVKPLWNGDYVTGFNARAHAIYNAERIIGLIYGAPFFLLGLVTPAVAVTRFASRPAATAGTGTQPPDYFFRWLMLTLTGLALLLLFVVFLVFYSTMRYFMDAAPTLAILSILGFWLISQRLAQRRTWQALFTLLALGVMLFTVVMGILVGFSSDLARLRAADPALLVHLRLFFITLARRLGR